jgi:ornithine carbamoyltransferase
MFALYNLKREGIVVNSEQRSFLSLMEMSPESFTTLLQLATQLKNEKKNGIYPQRLKNKNVGLIFEKLSTRTRSAFSVALHDEGAHADFLSTHDIHTGEKESWADTARVLGRFYDALVFRGSEQSKIENLAQHSSRPVINALTDDEHPTQAVADLLTLKERFGKLSGLRLVYVGDAANNVAHSLMLGAALCGVHFVVAAPESLWPQQRFLERARLLSAETGGSISLCTNPQVAVEGADAIYTDVWVSMGFESKLDVSSRIRLLAPYQVNSTLFEKTGKRDAVFLHCLPACKGMEVTEDVFESERSLVFEQAENRMHSIKAVLLRYLG